MNELLESKTPAPGQPPARRDRRRSAWRWIGALAALGLVGLGTVFPGDNKSLLNFAGFGYLFGTVLSLTTLAAAWAVLGTGKLARRMMLSALLVAAVVATFVINVVLHEAGDQALEVFVVFGMIFFGQWLFAQVPLWFLAIAYGLRLTSLFDEQADAPHTTRQFGIRQLMVLTAVVALVLGTGRLLVGWLMHEDQGFTASGEVFLVYGLIAASGVICLPLVLAMLLSRGAAIAAVVSLAFVVFATWAEWSGLQAIPNTLSPEVKWLFIPMNAFQAAWVLAITALLRWGGYRLTMKSAAGPAIG